MSIRGLSADLIPNSQNNTKRVIWQTVRRIANEILGVKGLNAWQTEGQDCDKFVNH